VLATPFVQGRLRKEPLSIVARTRCAHCDRPLGLEIDSELRCRVDGEGAKPLVFVPLVNFRKLKDPSIIDAF
jgi:hypothetical protein